MRTKRQARQNVSLKTSQPKSYLNNQHHQDTGRLTESLLVLEPRVLFDGAALITGAEVANEQLAQQEAETPNTSEPQAQEAPNKTHSQKTVFDSLMTLETPSDRRELVFLDTSIEEYQRLLAGINLNAEIVLLDTTRDGIEQIANALRTRTGIDAIHLISHGSQGELQLGTGRLTLNSMTGEYADELSVIKQALSNDADLLIYGCNFGEGQTGQAAATRLAQLTGADIAASNDRTGSAALGGDWDLEVATGRIETATAVAEAAQANWAGVLDITSDLVAHYEFDEGAGTTATDSTANSNDGTHQGSPSHVAGKIGSGALDLSTDTGSNSRVEVADDTSLDFGSGDFTVAFWYNSTQTPGGATRVLGQYAGTNGWIFFTNNVPHLSFSVDGDSGLRTAFFDTPDDGNWHHIVGVRNGNDIELFIDGASVHDVDSGATIGNIDNTETLFLGSNTSTDFDGKLDDIRLYDRALSSADITELYNYTGNTAPSITNLGDDALAYTEGDGAVVIDQSTNAVVTDADSADFDTGTLTVSFTAGSDSAEDVLAIQNQGTGAGQIGVSGSNVTYAGTTIGTFTGGTSGTNLVITLNSNADAAAVTALVQNITYENTDTDNPTTGVRTVRYVLTDGDGGTSANYDSTVTVNAENDAPANTVPGAQMVNEDTALIFNAANGNLISISDADAGNNPLRVTLTATNGTVTLSQTTDLTFNTGDGTADATIVFEGTLANINAALDGISFLGDQNFTGAANIQIITDDLTLTSLNEDTSLLGYYTFDDTGDLGNDDSPAGGQNGTTNGAVTNNDATRGNVLSLDGNDDYIDITGASALFGSPADLTLSAWVNYSSADTLGGEVISLGNNVMLRVDNGVRGVTGVFFDGTTWQYIDSSMSLADGNWHHIAFTFDDAGNAQALYINGVLAGSGNATESITYNQGANTRIGANASDTDNDFDFNGLIDDARIYDRALTATEIANLALEAPSTDTDNIAITVNAVNDTASVTNLSGDTLAYTEGDGAAIIEQGDDVVVTDVDSADFDTGSLTVQFTSGSDSAEDVLAIQNVGTGAGQISVSGSAVSYEGIQIGTFTGGSSGSNLVITFDSDATPTATTALIKNITYQNTDTDNPTTGSRSVRFTLNDGDGGATIRNTTVTFAAANDVPVITNLGGDTLAYTEGDGAQVIDQSTNAAVTDVDSTNFDTGTLTVSFTAGSDSDEDVLAIQNVGTGAGQISVAGSAVSYEGTQIGTFTGGSSGSNLVITFDSDATPTAVSALVQNITYENTDTDNPTTGDRTVRYVVTDGDGGTSANYDTTVTVSGDNDAPIATDDPGDFNSTVTALNPLSYWRLGEGAGGSAADDGSLGNNGTYNGVTLGQPGALNGDANTAVEFNGWSDYIEIAHDPGYLLDNGSVQLWFKADNIGNIETLFSKESEGFDTGGHLNIHILANGRIEARLQSNVGDNLVTSTNTVSAESWHHVVVTFGASGMTLHLDGALEDTNIYTGGLGATSGDIGNFEPIVIGASSRSSDDLVATPLTQYFGGLIDEVAIFGTQLNAASIQNLYATGVQAYPVLEDGMLSVSASEGVLNNDTDADGDGLTASLVAGPSNASAFTLNPDGSFTYTPVANFTGTDTFTYQVSDGNGGTDTATATITVTAVNDAPVLDNTGTMVLTNIAEDDTSSAGDTVAAIIASAGGNRITDVDTGAVEGLAVIGVDDTNGTWQYNAGSGWTAFGAVTNTNAVLLDTTSSIRFVPNASYTGTAGTITFHAWDTTTGIDGDTGVDVSTNGGTTAYSTETETATLTVTAVNDAPVLTPSTPTLTTITENDTTNSGDTISSIVTADITDVDSGAVEGLAITSLNSSNDTWQYNTGGGWTDVGAVANTSALLLRSTDSLRFVPDAQNADTASVTYRAWDQTTGSAGTKVDVSSNGGTTAFSTATDTASITVTAVNDAPVLDNTDTMVLTNIAEDDTSSAGDTVAAIIASAGGNRITDVDTGAVEGLAVIGVDDTNGTWQYNAGSGWTAFGAVTNTNAVLLDTTSSIRFVPNASYTGTAGTITFHAWDTTTGSDGDTGVDVSTNGGTTAYSTATETATLTVTAVNDAPVLTPSTPTLTTITENDTTNSGDTISSIVTTDITDVDSGAVEGLAITSLNSSNGTWQYNTGGGWTDVGAVSNTSALLLRSTDSLRFVPDAQNADTASVTYRAWDQTTGSAGTKVDVSTNGGTTAFSTATDTASITVTAVNDAPTITSDGEASTANVNVIEGNTSVTTVTATDVDLPADTLSYSLVGGADQGFFSIDANSGALTFHTAPAFASPADANMDNIYVVQVQVSDGNGGIDTQTIHVTVTDTNTAPIINSNGGGATANVNVAEGTTAITTVSATDVDLPGDTLSFRLVGGTDVSRFSINSTTGALTFQTTPDFENPGDANGDNVYHVQVQVSDGKGGTDMQSLRVSVTNIIEALPPVPESPQSSEPPTEPDSDPVSEETDDSIIQQTPLTSLETQAPVPAMLLTEATSDRSTDKSGASGEFEPVLYTQLDDLPTTYLSDLASVNLLTFEEISLNHRRADVRESSLAAMAINLDQQLDELAQHLQETIQHDRTREQIVSGLTTGTGVTISAGYIAWVLRGTSLLTSLFASLPAWGHFDPLPVLTGGYTARQAEQKSNQTEVDQENQEHQGIDKIFRDSE